MEREVEQLRSREKQLLGEIKKRGDIARQMCREKDDEIRSLREKLHMEQRQGYTPGGKITPGRGTSSGSGSLQKSSSFRTPRKTDTASVSDNGVPDKLRPPPITTQEAVDPDDQSPYEEVEESEAEQEQEITEVSLSLHLRDCIDICRFY